MDEALQHSNRCRELLGDGLLADALAYCSVQRVEPPHDLARPEALNGHDAHDFVTQMLGDYGWWVKRLKIRAVREAETLRIRQGLSALHR